MCRPRPSAGRCRASTKPGAVQAGIKALPAASKLEGHYRIRYDRVDTDGHVSIRRAGRMHHLGIGRRHARALIFALIDETAVTVVQIETGEVLSKHAIDPTRG